MKFDIEAYQKEVAKRFMEVNNELFEKFLEQKGFSDGEKITITPEQQKDPQFQSEFVGQLMGLDWKDVDNFTEEELRSYFIE